MISLSDGEWKIVKVLAVVLALVLTVAAVGCAYTETVPGKDEPDTGKETQTEEPGSKAEETEPQTEETEQQTDVTEPQTDETELEDSRDTETEKQETADDPPIPHTPGPTTFSSYEEMIQYLSENGIPYLCAGKPCEEKNAVAVRELKDLSGKHYDVGYIEWGEVYCVIYDNFFGGFWPVSSEDRLKELETSHLMCSGTYEELISNPKVSNVRKKDLTVSLGTGYECLYDTSVGKDFVLRYYEYKDEQNSVVYHISEEYKADQTFQFGNLFVYDGENSFELSYSEPGMTMETALGLSSVLYE